MYMDIGAGRIGAGHIGAGQEDDRFYIAQFTRKTFRPQGITPVSPQVKTIVYWFKPDCLRLDDNPGLNNAIASAREHRLMFQAIFILDPWYGNKFGDRNEYGSNVMLFLYECLVDLDRLLLKYYGVRLRVYVGMPDAIIRSLVVYWNIAKIIFQSCKMFPEIIAYEESLIKQCRTNQIWAEGYFSHSLYDPSVFVHMCKKQIPASFEKFELFVKNRNLGHPKPPVSFYKTMPHFDFCAGQGMWDGISLDMLHQYGFPPQDELFQGIYKGGETEAQRKLKMLVSESNNDDTDYYKMLVNKDAFSPYIRFGCISLKRLYFALLENKEKSPIKFERMLNGLLRREHSIVLGYFAYRLDCNEFNNLCIPIPWDVNRSYVTAFRKGATGFPWIDAIIRQIIQEGWACMEARNSIANFLTRAYLWISWVEGVKFFQEFMLDFELSVSAVCWMHSAKCFVGDDDDNLDPLQDGKRLDPKGKFIKKYIPELENYPAEYIHNPWELPVSEQKKTGYVIGVHYPNPIIDPGSYKGAIMQKIQDLARS